MSECRFGSGSVIEEADLPRLLSEDCIIEPGAVIRLFYHDEVTADAFGSGVVTNIPRKERQMEEEASGTQVQEPFHPEPAVPDEPAPIAAAKPQVKTAAGTEEAAPIDVTALTQMTGGGSSTTVLLALIAVLFGAAGWKFWTKISEQHHELKMKELELASSGNSDRSPQQCTAVHAKIEARLSALESSITEVQTNASSFDASFDPADLKKRITKVEKALKAKPKS